MDSAREAKIKQDLENRLEFLKKNGTLVSLTIDFLIAVFCYLVFGAEDALTYFWIGATVISLIMYALGKTPIPEDVNNVIGFVLRTAFLLGYVIVAPGLNPVALAYLVWCAMMLVTRLRKLFNQKPKTVSRFAKAKLG